MPLPQSLEIDLVGDSGDQLEDHDHEQQGENLASHSLKKY